MTKKSRPSSVTRTRIREKNDTFTLDEILKSRIILESITDGFQVLDKKWNFIYSNKQAERLIEVNNNEIIGKNIWKLFPHLKKTKFYQEYRRSLKENIHVSFEEYSERVNRWFQVKAYPITEGMIIFFHDITSLKRTEEMLLFLSEANKILSSSLDYKKTFESIAKIAVPKIADWCTIDILENGELQQVTIAHVDPDKIKWAKELRKSNPPDMNAPSGVPHVLRTGKPEFYPHITDEILVKTAKNKKELALLRKIGFTSAMIVPLLSQMKPIGAITFVRTETREPYKKTDLLMAEEIAGRSSNAIENARLYKGSQEAISLRDDFISVASHELKTPVTSVKMFTQVLKKHSEQIGDAKAVTHLSKMDKQLNKLTELIYDLLNISKIQAGRMEFREEMFDFDKVILEVVDVLQQSASKHTIVVKGKTGKKILGDEERIGQVINNLISNAIKYSPKADKVIVTLKAKNGNVVVSVQDFGIGMEKVHLVRIFEQFYRVYDTTDKTFPGLGIGLYISAEILKRHGGKMWVESVPGHGSIFFFSLPIKHR